MKNNGCVGCHQLGQIATRTIPAALGTFKSGEEAWARRIQSGQAWPNMVNAVAGSFGGVPLKYFGDWTDRIAKGELPPASRRDRKASSATSSSRRGIGAPTKQYLARPDLDRQAQSDGQRLRPDLRLAGIFAPTTSPILDPKTTARPSYFTGAGARPDMP